MHCWPGWPQELDPKVAQDVPWQHPVGQLFKSHTQSPASHSCPVPQAPPPPQVQLPAPLQASPEEPQLWHCCPAGAQASTPRTVQVVPEQQPDGQLLRSQTHRPASHS